MSYLQYVVIKFRKNLRVVIINYNNTPWEFSSVMLEFAKAGNLANMEKLCNKDCHPCDRSLNNVDQLFIFFFLDNLKLKLMINY